MTHYVIRFARRAVIAALFVTAALLGIVSGVWFAYAGDLPQVSALDDYSPSTITRVYASGGEVIGEFAIQRRVVVGYDDINPLLRQAIIATEDAEFDRHVGVNIWRIFVAAVVDIAERRRAQGASTLTQQVARNLDQFGLTKQKLFERKVREWILAIQIEKRYTKQEIFAIYCNQMYLGHGAYGVEAASRLYFNKTNKQLSLEEAALVAGIFQTPERQSPFVDMRRATNRRNVVLQRMADERYITQDQANAAKQKPVVTRGAPTQPPGVAPFFVEEIRKHLEEKFGVKQLYENGLAVRSSLDVGLQVAANRAIDRGLRQLDKRRGFRKAAVKNILTGSQTAATYKNDRWNRPIAAGSIVPAVVTTVSSTAALLRVGGYHAELRRDGFAWTRRTAATDLFKAGDLIEVSVTKLDEASQTLTVTLEQTPVVEGALLAIDNHTGQIRAMVGGFNFERSKFNRAIQAYRQVGSGFKPFVYTAAIDRGFTPISTISDTPVSFPAGPGQPMYSPQNYDGKFEGPVTLRRALEDSRNVPAVRMMEQLGPAQVIAYARRFGLTGKLEPYLSLALGATEETLLEMTSAYSVFPNQGIRMTPYSIVKVSDREGSVLEENRPEAHDAIRADTAFVMTNLLRGVVQHGTGARASALNWPLGGKTGTTDDFSDAWFIGFDPNITVGVWVGHDERKPLGGSETGAVAALPIWMDFMQTYLEGKDREHPAQFEPPSNIVFLAVNRSPEDTAAEAPEAAVGEAFISGTEPR